MYIIGGRPLFSQLPFIISMIAHLYGLWVVNCYVDELRTVQLEEKVKEADEQREREQEERETSNSYYEVPNGIEAIQKKRLEEGL